MYQKLRDETNPSALFVGPSIPPLSQRTRDDAAGWDSSAGQKLTKMKRVRDVFADSDRQHKIQIIGELLAEYGYTGHDAHVARGERQLTTMEHEFDDVDLEELVDSALNLAALGRGDTATSTDRDLLERTVTEIWRREAQGSEDGQGFRNVPATSDAASTFPADHSDDARLLAKVHSAFLIKVRELDEMIDGLERIIPERQTCHGESLSRCMQLNARWESRLHKIESFMKVLWGETEMYKCNEGVDCKYPAEAAAIARALNRRQDRLNNAVGHFYEEDNRESDKSATSPADSEIELSAMERGLRDLKRFVRSFF
jgi:hypothetical protein